MTQDSKNIINLVDEDGKTIQLETLGTVEMDNGNNYVVLMPLEDEETENEDNTDEVVIMQVTNENGEDIYLPVEDDELLDQIFEAFQKEY